MGWRWRETSQDFHKKTFLPTSARTRPLPVAPRPLGTSEPQNLASSGRPDSDQRFACGDTGKLAVGSVASYHRPFIRNGFRPQTLYPKRLPTTEKSLPRLLCQRSTESCSRLSFRPPRNPFLPLPTMGRPKILPLPTTRKSLPPASDHIEAAPVPRSTVHGPPFHPSTLPLPTTNQTPQAKRQKHGRKRSGFSRWTQRWNPSAECWSEARRF